MSEAGHRNILGKRVRDIRTGYCGTAESVTFDMNGRVWVVVAHPAHDVTWPPPVRRTVEFRRLEAAR